MRDTTGKRPAFRFDLREASGGAADLGTLLPLGLAMVGAGAAAPMPMLLGFALFYIATGLVYRLPLPVQPMKAVAAIAIATGVSAGELAASGMLIGATLLVLGLTGWITRLARLVPQSILTGLQLGLGLVLAVAALKLMATALAGGVAILLVVAGLLAFTRLPAALIGLAAAMILGWLAGLPAIATTGAAHQTAAWPIVPTLADFSAAATGLALPQMTLTITNAIILTSLLARDYFADEAGHVTPARLSITSGLANLLLAPFGAIPMCHGAGGLAAHYRFNARSGGAPVMIGGTLLLVALLPHRVGWQLLHAVPAAGLGALLLVASWQLARSRRLVDACGSCWSVILATAAVTVWFDPFLGLCAGTVTEVVRKIVVRRLFAKGNDRTGHSNGGGS